MSDNQRKIENYLARIGYDGPTTPTLEVLRQLHRHHLFHIPFENLDIHLGRPILIDLENLYKKIVIQERGGFCYELNGLFAWLLQELGFEVILLGARSIEDGKFGPEFDHLTLKVRLEEKDWLADVGFGYSFLEPLAFEYFQEQNQGGKSFRLDFEEEAVTYLRKQSGGTWKPEYIFTLAPRQLEEYETMSEYHQNSPDSHFTQRRVCTLPLEEGGWVILKNFRLIRTKQGLHNEYDLTENEYKKVLEENFGIRLDSPQWKI